LAELPAVEGCDLLQPVGRGEYHVVSARPAAGTDVGRPGVLPAIEGVGRLPTLSYHTSNSGHGQEGCDPQPEQERHPTHHSPPFPKRGLLRGRTATPTCPARLSELEP
jgi:hypothetical protein